MVTPRNPVTIAFSFMTRRGESKRFPRILDSIFFGEFVLLGFLQFSLVIDQEHQLLVGNEFAKPKVLRRELVFAVRRKQMPHGHAAARAER